MTRRKSGLGLERLLERIKKTPLVSASIAVGSAIIALSSFTDAARNLTGMATRKSPEQARAELGRMSIEYSPRSLVRKASEGDVLAVQLLLRAGVDPDAADDQEDEGTALMRAAQHGDAAIVRALLDAGAHVNQKSRDGGGALSWAAERGHREVVEVLLAAGADASSINRALTEALVHDHRDLARLLIDRGGDLKQVGAQALSDAIRDGSNQEFSEAARFILSLDIDVNGLDAQGFAPLHKAAFLRNTAAAKALLEKGADLDLVCECRGVRGAKNWTALQLAAANHDAATLEVLVAAGANVRLENTEKSTALHLLRDGDSQGILRLLIARGADVNAKDVYGRTPLMTVSGDATALTQILLDSGADIDARDNEGWTALMHRADGDDDETVRVLMDRKADIHAKSTEGRTALMVAAERGASRVVRVLLDARARVQEKDRDGKTAVDYAAESTSPNAELVVRLLKQRGAR